MSRYDERITVEQEPNPRKAMREGEAVVARRDIIEEANDYSPRSLLAAKGDRLVLLRVGEPTVDRPYSLSVAHPGARGSFLCSPDEVEKEPGK